MRITKFFTLVLLTLFSVGACDFSKVKNELHTYEGKYGISFSIEDSKSRRVFKKQITDSFTVRLDGGDTLIVKSSWIEHKWTFKEDQSKSQVQDGEQLVIEFETNQWMDSYLIDWIIVSESTLKSLGSVGDNSCYLRHSNELDIKDREFVILSGGALAKDSTQIMSRKIGGFTLK